MPSTTGIKKIVPYTPSSFPTIPGAEGQFWARELRKISQSIQTISQLLQAGQVGVTELAGLPTTSDLAAGTGGLFKDTSGGGVYFAYNDAGTIKKGTLT